MRNVTVNADDFGYTPTVNKAIIELFDSNKINSTTIMANMPSFDEAIELAHKHKIENKIGAHLVLTEGQPLTDEIKSVPYLFTKEQQSQAVYIKNLFFLNKRQKTLIFNEYSKQIEKIKANGIQITHLDTHLQLHDNWGITQVLLSLLKTYNIPSIRILNNLQVNEFYKNYYRNLINAYLKKKRVNFSDYFGNRVDYLLTLQKYPDFTKNKTLELMVHPDFNSAGQLIDFHHKKEYDFDYLS